MPNQYKKKNIFHIPEFEFSTKISACEKFELNFVEFISQRIIFLLSPQKHPPLRGWYQMST